MVEFYVKNYAILTWLLKKQQFIKNDSNSGSKVSEDLN